MEQIRDLLVKPKNFACACAGADVPVRGTKSLCVPGRDPSRRGLGDYSQLASGKEEREQELGTVFRLSLGQSRRDVGQGWIRAVSVLRVTFPSSVSRFESV